MLSFCDSLSFFGVSFPGYKPNNRAGLACIAGRGRVRGPGCWFMLFSKCLGLVCMFLKEQIMDLDNEEQNNFFDVTFHMISHLGNFTSLD